MIRPLLCFLAAESVLAICIVRVMQAFILLGIPLGPNPVLAVFLFAVVFTLLTVILIISTFRRRWICAECAKHFKAEFIRASF